jgi:hypothetical protein
VTARRGIYLAGDWTATGLPATIEGAAGSGFAAAEALLDHRLRTGAASPPHDAVRPRSLS